jgi:hypothetical protein
VGFAAAAPVSLAQTLDLTESVAPRGDGFTALADVPDTGEDACIDGDQSTIASEVFATQYFGLDSG